MAFQSDLTSFLRNTLSGAVENPAAATNVLLIPIGKRTNLGQAKNQINAAFDSVEESIKKLVAGDEKKLDFIPTYKPPETANQGFIKKSVKKGGQGDFLFSLLGLVAGGIADLVYQKQKEIREYANNLVKSVQGWFEDKKNQVKDLLDKGMGILNKAIDSISSAYDNLIKKVVDTTNDVLDKGIGILKAQADIWSDAAKKTDISVEHVTELGAPKIPVDARVAATGHIKRFLNNLVISVKNWLNSIFGGENQQLDLSGGGGEGFGSLGGAASGGGNPFSAGGSYSGSGGDYSSLGRKMGGMFAPGGGNVTTSVPMRGVDKNYQSRIGAAMFYMRDQLIKEGVPEEKAKAAAALLVGQAMAESALIPTTVHDKGTGYGIYGARLDRATTMLKWLKDNGYSRDSLEGQVREMAHQAMTNKSFGITKQALMNADEGNVLAATPYITKNFENPAVIGNRNAQVGTAYKFGPVDPKGADKVPEASSGPSATPGYSERAIPEAEIPSANSSTKNNVGNIGDAKAMGDVVPVVPMTPLATPEPDKDKTSENDTGGNSNSDSVVAMSTFRKTIPTVSTLGEINQYSRKIA